MGNFNHADIELDLGTGCLVSDGENELCVIGKDVDVLRVNDAG